MFATRSVDDPHADFAAWVQHRFHDLADRQAEKVEQSLRELLTVAGLDPDDRSVGWQERARTALAGLEVDTSFDWADDGRMMATTVIRRRS